jgi:hypothetical protein
MLVLGIGILIVCMLLWYSYRVEGFQLTDPAAIKDNFWKLTQTTQPTLIAQLAQVRSPDPNDPNDMIPVKFSKYISMYALAKYNYDVSGARQALFSQYDTLQSEMSSNLYDQGAVTAWKNNPKGQTCAQLNSLMNTFTTKLATLRTSVQDLSGTAVLAGSMRDENMGYQMKYKNTCKKNPTTPECMRLASQEGPVFPLLTQYTTVNNSLFSNEYDLSNNIQTLQATYDILQCTNPSPTTNFEVQKTTGFIDTSTLLTKLQDFSPYYLSPDTLTYITGSIVSATDSQASVATTSDVYINIANIINNIKTLTNT